MQMEAGRELRKSPTSISRQRLLEMHHRKKRFVSGEREEEGRGKGGNVVNLS